MKKQKDIDEMEDEAQRNNIVVSANRRVHREGVTCERKNEGQSNERKPLISPP